jgi:hypothetical protein
MKPITWGGIVRIVLGVWVFVYQGINYTHKKTILDVGSVHIATETHERIPLSLRYLEGWHSLEGSSWWSRG